MSELSQDEGGFRFESLEIGQVDENDPAEVVLLHEPALSNWMGSIHPNGSLFELPLNLKKAKEEQNNFRKELERAGCKVITVKEILLRDCDTNLVARVELEDLAFKSISYELVGTDPSTLTENDRYYLSNEYKKECVEKMNVDQLVEVVLTNPRIQLKKADKNTELLAVNYSFHPLGNLVFTHDQQLVTMKGIVIASLSSPLRKKEIEVMKFCFKKLKWKIIGEVPPPALIEGGDFFPAGKDLCFVGVGLRSNMIAVTYMMENDLFGTNSIAVVKDYFDQDQQRMHLDTVFNIVGKKHALISQSIMGINSPIRRLVDEYQKDMYGVYRLKKHDVEFSEYLDQAGYTLLPVSDEDQKRYGCNCLNLGNGTIIAVEPNISKKLARTPHFDGKISLVDFHDMSRMYGSVHCCSQVMVRKKAQITSTEGALELFMAARIGDLQGIRSLALTTDLNAVDYDQRTALHIACSSGKLNVVSFLVREGVRFNCSDRRGNTPLDDAIAFGDEEIINLLKSQGAVTGQVLVQKMHEPFMVPVSPMLRRRNPQEAHRVLMIAPNHFHACLTEDNIWMKNSEKIESEIERVKGRRQLIQEVSKEFAELHRIITNFGVECFLFSHDAFVDAPDSVFCEDWFSTHPPDDRHPQGVLVIYSLMLPSRRREKRADLIEFLQGMYPTCINFSHLEAGRLQVSNSFQIPNTEDCVGQPHFLERGALVFDKKQKIVFCTPSKRCSLVAADLWAKEMGYKLVSFKLKETLHHTDYMMTIGTNFVLVCYDIIADEDKQKVKENLEIDPRKVIVDVSVAQMRNFCCSAIELFEKESQLVIFSTTAYNSFLPEQLEKLNSKIKNLKHVDLKILENVGGGCISSMVNQLH